ncbi:MAG: hypothetical protein JST92_16645 [Deltaproteobacteria bacterium]|nr:hypothetical protein [Deltaproteobacteria bacterium]
MSIRHALIGLASLSFAACATSATTGYRVRGEVRALHAGSRDASGITSVSGAKVDLVCPESSQSKQLGQTDASGSIQAEGDGLVSLACQVQVGGPGLQTRQYPVASVCSEQSSGACRELAFKAIVPASSGSGGDAR